jgi:hypothetical protein
MNLSWVQLDCLLDGMKELSQLRNKAIEKNKQVSKKSDTGKYGKKSGQSIDSPLALFNMPGFKVSPKAKKKLIEMLNSKNNKAKDE